MIVIGDQRHELIGIDGQGQLCSCGAKDPAFVEHLADVLTEAFGVRRYWPIKSNGGATIERPRIGLKVAA